MTETPGIPEVPWWTTPPAPVATCSIEAVEVRPVAYPLASVQPGHTTEEQIEQMLGPPDQVFGDGDYWYYAFPMEADFVFRDEIVVEQCEFRRLKEVLAWYGTPEQVIWELPKLKFDEAAERTYLLFSEREGFCQTEKWVANFQNDEARFYCCFYPPKELDQVVAKYPTEEEVEGHWIVEVDWPCPDF